MHHTIGRTFLLSLKVIAGLLMGFGVAYTLGFGGTQEILLIGVATALGVWGVDAVAVFNTGGNPSFWNLGTTLGGAALGVALILLTPPFGFVELLLPLVGALLGNYLENS